MLSDNANDKNNFPNKFLLTNKQVSMLHKAFANNSSANIKLSKIRLHTIGQSGEFLGKLLGPLLKTGLLLLENVLKPLVKSVLIRINSSSIISNRCSYSYENFQIWFYSINNF